MVCSLSMDQYQLLSFWNPANHPKAHDYLQALLLDRLTRSRSLRVLEVLDLFKNMYPSLSFLFLPHSLISCIFRLHSYPLTSTFFCRVFFFTRCPRLASYDGRNYIKEYANSCFGIPSKTWILGNTTNNKNEHVPTQTLSIKGPWCLYFFFPAIFLRKT